LTARAARSFPGSPAGWDGSKRKNDPFIHEMYFPVFERIEARERFLGTTEIGIVLSLTI
jgi:hypothetical protein